MGKPSGTAKPAQNPVPRKPSALADVMEIFTEFVQERHLGVLLQMMSS